MNLHLIYVDEGIRETKGQVRSEITFPSISIVGVPNRLSELINYSFCASPGPCLLRGSLVDDRHEVTTTTPDRTLGLGTGCRVSLGMTTGVPNHRGDSTPRKTVTIEG